MNVSLLIDEPPMNNGFVYRHYIRALAVKLDIHHTGLRTNGGGAEMVGEFPFMLSTVEAFLGFFSRITI
jgi:hypothetical protein